MYVLLFVFLCGVVVCVFYNFAHFLGSLLYLVGEDASD